MIGCEAVQAGTGAAPPLIAVVDDDASFLRAAGRLLRSAGYAVEAFTSARQFLASLAGAWPRCLVLDVHMPEMTGLQLQDTLMAQNCCVPTIFVTSDDTPQMRQQARKAGAFGFLLKPFTNQNLLTAVQDAVRCEGDVTAAKGGPR